MSVKRRSAFFAYPAGPIDLVGPIAAAAKAVQAGTSLDLRVWPQLEVFGANIPDKIRKDIDEVDVLVCDITRPNANVYYEAGYGIGAGKVVAPVVNVSFAGVSADIQRDGLFDNIGYKPYENSAQLAAILSDLPQTALLELYQKQINFQQPLYLLDSFRKTDFRNSIVSAIKASKAFYRSFDPGETPRLSTVSLISDITASTGVVVPFLAENVDDADRHNLRAAFIAGFSHGLQRATLLLRLDTGDRKQPADYRDLIISVKNEGEIEERVAEFVKLALIDGQSIKQAAPRRSKSGLQQLTLGSSAAENEFRTLEEYFVETSEFVRTLKGEIRVLTGRKGSGKTAIFFMVRDNIRPDKNSYVTDLKPESHQLSHFREELLKIVDIGVFDHTLASFWYFLVLSEVLLKIADEIYHRAKNDGRMLERAREIERLFERFGVATSGDFTSRINRLSVYVIQEIERATSRGERLSPERLTNIVFRDGITEIKSLILKNTDGRSRLVFLFDNIDKGWPTSGVSPFDIRLVRLLIEALDKVRRDFDTADREFMSVMFLRNDIYELLVEETPDRGKAGQIRIDWTDRAKLKQVIYRRLSQGKAHPASFNDVWSTYFTQKVGGQDAFEYFVDHCLMRPRFLINIIENAVSNAINRGHTSATEEDCIDAVRQHSLYLVDDFGYEIRDVSGITADILYSLVGAPRETTEADINTRLVAHGLSVEHTVEAFKLLLWYGVLGIKGRAAGEHYIYDFEYNMKRLDAEIKLGSGTFVINPALHIALA